MKALSVRQPWAWLILHAGKDIENRVWSTSVRGRILLHASKGMTVDEYEGASEFVSEINDPYIVLPQYELLERGGIVGSVEIVGCVQESMSPWFTGPFGFVLRGAEAMTFYPWRGALGFFDA